MPLMVSQASTASAILEQAVEQLTGESVALLRSRSLEETRKVAEKRHGRAFRFISRFPFIGRGNVLRDRLVTRKDVEATLDRALNG